MPVPAHMFKIGDRIEHLSHGPGTVANIVYVNSLIVNLDVVFDCGECGFGSAGPGRYRANVNYCTLIDRPGSKRRYGPFVPVPKALPG